MRVRFELDGESREVEAGPSESLLVALRERLEARAVKDGCGQGECGSCSVLLDGLLVNACLVPAAQAEGRRVTTVAGLKAVGEQLQRAFAETGAVQCGYCTPGMVLAGAELLARDRAPSRERIAAALAGNLCRCTGYAKIIDAIELAARRHDRGAS